MRNELTGLVQYLTQRGLADIKKSFLFSLSNYYNEWTIPLAEVSSLEGKTLVSRMNKNPCKHFTPSGVCVRYLNSNKN